VPFNRPSLSSLIDRVKADLDSRLAGDPFLPRSFEAALSTVHAGVAHGLHGHLAWVARQAVPTVDADESTLLRWANLFLSPARVQATKASGPATFNGTDGTVLPGGREVQLQDGTKYTVDSSGTVSGGSVTVDVTAVAPGIQGNADQGATIKLSSPIAGLDTEGTVGSGGLTGGTDIEPIADVLDRLQRRLAQPPRGGGPGDFEEWALETPDVDVDKAWEDPKRNGAGTVAVFFTVENGPIPTSQQVNDVQSYIDSKRPTFMRQSTVLAPIAQPLTATIELKPNTAEVRQAVLNELQDLIDREAVPEQKLLRSHIREAISNAKGEKDHKLPTPSSDVDPGTAGLVTFDSNQISFQAL
jgi:uncharacterized phage protein gp47/JayE